MAEPPGRSDGQSAAHRCPHPACTKRVRSGYLSCAPHWFELPVGLRLEIYRAYEAEPGGEAHLAAIAQAMVFWRA